MKKRTLCVLALFMLNGLFLYAGKPWKDKSFTEWTAKEVQQVLFDSPWIKKDSVGIWAGRRTSQVPSSMGGRRSGGGRGGGSGGSSSGAGDEQVIRQLYWLQLTWVSEPIRQAYARASELAGQSPSPLQRNPEILQFFVQGEGLSRLVYAGDESVLKLSYLKPRKRDPVSPIQVVFREPFEPEPLILVAFPAEIDGKPTVTLEDKDVEVVIQLGQGKLKAKFKLKDMVIDGKLVL